MEFNGDPTGFISHCMSELIKVGFDASAISLAKWVGVALLVAIFLAAAVTFYSRLRHGKDILPVLSDTHFKMILAAGLLLVVLPMIAKISGDAFDVSLASADRDFAQRICQDSLDVTAATAQAEAVKARLDVLEGNLQTIQVAMNQNPPSGTGQETSERILEVGTDLTGQAVSIFYRPGRTGDAVLIKDRLEAAGAGVALRQDEMRNAALKGTTTAGATHILFTSQGAEHISDLEILLSEIELTASETHGPTPLRGTAIQLLLF